MSNKEGVPGSCRDAEGRLSRWSGALALVLLGGCGGGSGGSSTPAPTPTPTPATATIAVSVLGLRTGQQIILANNGGDRLTISANGSFSFANPVTVNAGYAVTVATPPSGETCILSNAMGTVASSGTVTVPLTCGPTILHSFAGADGSSDPNTFNQSPNVTLAADGNIYGTIVRGGANGFGTIFKLTAAGAFTILHHFAEGADGKYPEAPLVEGIGGELYGTTSLGGAFGQGTIFKISRDGTFTLLHSFAGATDDGGFPKAALVQSGSSFYGTTYSGGKFDLGTIFKVTSSGNVSVLYSFSGADGGAPSAPLVIGNDGNYYGTTSGGGSRQGGLLFRITPDGVFTTLRDFGDTDGTYLYGPLALDSSGNIFGTVHSGASSNRAIASGIIFRLSPMGGYTVLHRFSGADGAWPVGGLIWGADGNLYGTTSTGGVDGSTAGTIFRITPAGDFTLLHTFKGSLDGRAPYSPLIRDQSGVLYGATAGGGVGNLGTIFRF